MRHPNAMCRRVSARDAQWDRALKAAHGHDSEGPAVSPRLPVSGLVSGPAIEALDALYQACDALYKPEGPAATRSPGEGRHSGDEGPCEDQADREP